MNTTKLTLNFIKKKCKENGVFVENIDKSYV